MENLIKTILFFMPDNVLDPALFELKSCIGRLFSRRLQTDPSGPVHINLGSGNMPRAGFVNLDFFFTKNIDYGADLRFPLRINSKCADGIFSEHTSEHLTYDENARLFRECFRILKDNGVIRLIVPDLSIFIHSYVSGDSGWFAEWERNMFIDSPLPDRARRRLRTPLQAISFVTQEYGHVSCWDFDTLRTLLEDSGFSEIRKVGFREGQNPALLIDRDLPARRQVSLYVEARKKVQHQETSTHEFL